MKAIKELLSDNDGSWSTMRISVLLVVLAVLFNWCYLTVRTGSPQPLDWSTVTLVIGSLGAKALQKPFESEPPLAVVAPVIAPVVAPVTQVVKA